MGANDIIRQQANDIIRQQREKILADVTAKYIKAGVQLMSTLSAVDRQTLQNQLTLLEQEMQEAEAKLAVLPSPNQHTHDARLKKALYKIDFTEVVDCVKTTLQSFGAAGGAALFLLEKSYEMAGECCLGRIRELLEAETHPAGFREYPVDFSIGMALNEYGLFQRLGEHVGVESDVADLTNYVRLLIQKICAPLQHGSVVFLVFNKWDLLADGQERVFRQFLDLLWEPLLNQFLLEQKRRIKVVAMITAEWPLSPACHTLPWRYSHPAFTVAKIQRLPLRHWTCDDIQTWIERYSGTGWAAHQIDQFAQYLSGSCQGFPRYIYEKLSQEFVVTQEV